VIVNDGSSDDTATILDNLCAQHQALFAIHQSVNSGKGGAVCRGLAWALSQGYSHALLVDADGQHATGDIPRFLAAAEDAPTSLILGAPRFGEDAPLARRIGREVSNALAGVATWSFAARDVLCGFRVYPVRVLVDCVEIDQLQQRMGFDVDIVIRSIWCGLGVVNIPTKVVYPENGVSHYRYMADNLQMVKLYQKLVLFGLIRGPMRILGMGGTPRRREWYSIAERGSLRGLRFLLLILEKVGRLPLLLIMIPVVLHMFVWGRVARRAAIEFQRVVTTRDGRSTSECTLVVRALRQFWEFGVSIVEKVTSWRDGVPLERFTWIGRDEVKAHLAAGRGVIFMGAHVGNVEVIRAIGEKRKVVVNALMFTANSRQFRRFLEEINERAFLRVIDVSTVDPSMILDIQERLNRGEIVAILGDRVPKHSANRVVEVSFLGRQAHFPEGPWILCSLVDAPVYTVFSMRERGGRYTVAFEHLADKVSLPRVDRKRAIEGYAQEFAARLERVAERYPFQWFNFYDLWSGPSNRVS
jgi:predicted LPLAT superfamily acyltransferase